jgi:hypothetical protein
LFSSIYQVPTSGLTALGRDPHTATLLQSVADPTVPEPGCGGVAMGVVRLFGEEDATMCYALKQGGRFVVIWDSAVNSGRRTQGLARFRMLLALFYMAFYPRMLTRRASVKKVWYESDRGADKCVCNSSVVRALKNIDRDILRRLGNRLNS